MEKFTIQNDKYANLILEIQKAIKGTKWENHVFLVGGAVRDILMGKPMKDIDLCIDMKDGGVQFATWLTQEYNCKTPNNPQIFPRFGTAHFNLRTIHEFKDIDIECVQTRKEVYGDDGSRKPDTEFGTIYEDARRRDLTINALYINISKNEILDPNRSGFEDLKKQILRTPTDPDKTFNEDPLRMMRVIRFATRFGWGIEKKTWLGIIKNVDRISIVSQERITDEFNKILVCEKPSYGIRQLKNCGLLARILPNINILSSVEQNEYHYENVFDHTMTVLDKTNPNIISRLGALFHDVGKYSTQKEINGRIHFYSHEHVGAKLTKEILHEMKYPLTVTNKVTTIVGNHMKFKVYSDRCPSNRILRRFLATVDKEVIPSILDVIHADNTSVKEEYQLTKQIPLITEKLTEIQNEKNSPSKKMKLPINGDDIMKHYEIKKGPIIGEFLTIVREAILDDPSLSVEELYQILDTYILCKG